MVKIFKKEPAFVLYYSVFKLTLLIWFEYLEKLSGEFDPRLPFDRLPVNAEHSIN
jgi:hypothetical protein